MTRILNYILKVADEYEDINAGVSWHHLVDLQFTEVL